MVICRLQCTWTPNNKTEKEKQYLQKLCLLSKEIVLASEYYHTCVIVLLFFSSAFLAKRTFLFCILLCNLFLFFILFISGFLISINLMEKIITKWHLNSTSITNYNIVVSKWFFNILNQQRCSFQTGLMDYGNW